MVPFTLDAAGITDNLCKVEVFYEQFDYESIEESEAYPVIRLITHTVLSLEFSVAHKTQLSFLRRKPHKQQRECMGQRVI